ncbi:MAG: phosphate signaling complex protein PhoU [Peptococcaceae bacterium]|jgi:phosphate transport system protein|nr:phosphate signaling complex protein PhoU [Peptococcaceae bacterium]
MRNKLEAQLEALNDKLIEMGALTESAIAMSIQALERQDAALARKTIAFDTDIDQMEKDIETLCLRLLLQQQPVAGDLRLISAALKMITDMERIGDQAADIAEISIFLMDTPYIKKLEHIPQMASAAMKMVTDSLDSFVKKDLSLANAVIAYDDVVDGLFEQVKADLIELIHADSKNGGQAIDLIMIAKYLERIGDHAVNIAEWVVFSIAGRHNESFQKRYD